LFPLNHAKLKDSNVFARENKEGLIEIVARINIYHGDAVMLDYGDKYDMNAKLVYKSQRLK
jgi:hypothetical protein